MLEQLFSSLLQTAAQAPIIVINDASPDARVGAFLQNLQGSGFDDLTVLRNEKNLGFVATVNRGISACDGDVILLNQDTIVTDGWYEKLQAAGEQHQVATVTPMTNNGEIASVPELCVNHQVPQFPALMAKACELACELAGNPLYPQVPTAVGFCMLIKRQCIDTIGLLDAEHYGHGYGEENDYSCRAQAAGFRNILCDNAYVAHVGNQSFQDLGLQPNDEALNKVLARYPDYMNSVHEFIANDPLHSRRQKIGEIYQQLIKQQTTTIE